MKALAGCSGFFLEVGATALGQAALGMLRGRAISMGWVGACEITAEQERQERLYFLWVQTCFAYEPLVTNNFSAR